MTHPFDWDLLVRYLREIFPEKVFSVRSNSYLDRKSYGTVL
jgi:predicted AAA+ superfamily ATPase